jgi:hypothetical protein
MSTWRIEDIEEAKGAEGVEAEDSVAAESRFARKLASFGMVVGGYYTPGRIKSEVYIAQGQSLAFRYCSASIHSVLI